MNAAHMHLVFGHLPIVGLPIFLALFLLSKKLLNSQLRLISLWGITIFGLTLLPLYLTGEGAEEIVEHIVGISEHQIEEHEELGEKALIGALATSLLAFILVIGRIPSRLTPVVEIATLLTGLTAVIVIGLTAQEGGKIRHPEAFAESASGEHT